ESFGRRDTAAADAEMLSLGLEATTHYGIDAPDIRMGDVGLFSALIAALDLAPAWKRRLVKDFNRAGSLAHDLDRLVSAAASERPEYQGVLAALAGSDPKAAHALVTDLLSIAGIRTVGGRTVDEIADRFLDQAAIGAGSGLPHEIAALIQRFLAVKGDPDSAAAEPSKGRLHDKAVAFFARAGLELTKPRGERDYRGTIADLPGIEIAYLSSAEIADLLAEGAVHIGVTGEDLIREVIADADRRVV